LAQDEGTFKGKLGLASEDIFTRAPFPTLADFHVETRTVTENCLL